MKFATPEQSCLTYCNTLSKAGERNARPCELNSELASLEERKDCSAKI